MLRGLTPYSHSSLSQLELRLHYLFKKLFIHCLHKTFFIFPFYSLRRRCALSFSVFFFSFSRFLLLFSHSLLVASFTLLLLFLIYELFYFVYTRTTLKVSASRNNSKFENSLINFLLIFTLLRQLFLSSLLHFTCGLTFYRIHQAKLTLLLHWETKKNEINSETWSRTRPSLRYSECRLFFLIRDSIIELYYDQKWEPLWKMVDEKRRKVPMWGEIFGNLWNFPVASRRCLRWSSASMPDHDYDDDDDADEESGCREGSCRLFIIFPLTYKCRMKSLQTKNNSQHSA